MSYLPQSSFWLEEKHVHVLERTFRNYSFQVNSLCDSFAPVIYEQTSALQSEIFT